MTWQTADPHPSFRTAYVAVLLALPAITAIGDDRSSQATGVEDVAIERLLEQLRSDPERNAGETSGDWFRRIAQKDLDVAGKILVHPDATAQQQAEAIDRKLSALSLLAKREPERYKERWRAFAHRVIVEHPNSSLARDAASLVLHHKINDDPADPEIESGIDCFAQTYPESGGHAYQLYYRLSGLVYEHDPDRALAILDRAGSALPPDLAGAIRQYRNKLTMIGSELTMSWPKLDGGAFAVNELRGKVVFVYSWATWCGPCIEKPGRAGCAGRERL